MKEIGKQVKIPSEHIGAKYTKVYEIIKPLIFLAILVLVFSVFVVRMGLPNTLNTLMNTAYRLLIDTTFILWLSPC